MRISGDLDGVCLLELPGAAGGMDLRYIRLHSVGSTRLDNGELVSLGLISIELWERIEEVTSSGWRSFHTYNDLHGEGGSCTYSTLLKAGGPSRLLT